MSIVSLFGVLFSQQIREDLVRAATSPVGVGDGGKPHAGYLATQITAAKTITFFDTRNLTKVRGKGSYVWNILLLLHIVPFCFSLVSV